MNQTEKQEYPHQIGKFSTAHSFLTISNDGFEIDKVKFFAAEYNLKGPRTVEAENAKAFFTLDTDKFLELCSLIESDRINNKIEQLMEMDGKLPWTTLRSYNGGSNRSDGTVEARTMTVSMTVSEKTDKNGKTVKKPLFQINIARGPGKLIGNGLMAFKGKPPVSISVTMGYEDIKGVLFQVREHYRAFLTSQYCAGAINYHFETTSTRRAG